MPYSNPDLCRVALHADAVHVDLALPAGVAVAALLPSIVDILAGSGGAPPIARAGAAYRLSRPGAAALDGSKTLAQQEIRDGEVLLLTRAVGELPAPRFDDPAEQVCATVRAAARPWTPRATRFTGVLAASWLAAVAGFVAVPGGPGAPNALLAATAAAAVAVPAMHLVDGGPAMTAVCCLVALAAVAALAAVLGLSPQVIAAATAAASIGLLQLAARASIVCTGLARRMHSSAGPADGRDDGTARAHDLLTGLVAASSAAAALGVLGATVATVASVASVAPRTGAPPFGGVAFAAVCGAALLLRTRSHTDRSQIAALLTAAMAAFSAALVTAAAAVWQHPLPLCVTAAALAGTALYLGVVSSAPRVWSPVTRRGVELLEYLALAALAPVACWACGCYGAARGLSLA